MAIANIPSHTEAPDLKDKLSDMAAAKTLITNARLINEGEILERAQAAIAETITDDEDR